MTTIFQFMRFVITGATSTAVDFMALHLLLRSGVAQYIAIAVAFFCGLVVNLLLHKFFTFRDGSDFTVTQVGRFMAVVGINLTVTEAIVWWATRVASLGPYVGKLLSLPPVLAVGFILSRTWVFRPRH